MAKRARSATLKFLLDGVEHVLVIAPETAGLEGAGLTAAERAVAEDVLRGLSNRRIAARRGVSQRTVANQLAAVYRKLAVRSRLELVRKGGLVKPSRGRAR
jgi:DNA-binding NarL/FixJ family response regulator